MLETLIIARDRFLTVEGDVFPSLGAILFAPLEDPALYEVNILCTTLN